LEALLESELDSAPDRKKSAENLGVCFAITFLSEEDEEDVEEDDDEDDDEDLWNAPPLKKSIENFGVCRTTNPDSFDSDLSEELSGASEATMSVTLICILSSSSFSFCPGRMAT
jgi:hypothetical protein